MCYSNPVSNSEVQIAQTNDLTTKKYVFEMNNNMYDIRQTYFKRKYDSLGERIQVGHAWNLD